MSVSPLVVDVDTDLSSGLAREAVPGGGAAVRARVSKSVRAFEVHAALSSVRAAGHLVDVCLGRLMRLMIDGSGYRRWGTRSFGDYIVEDLRQPSVRRFRYLVAIDRAIVERPLPRLGAAWRRGEVSAAQARALIRVMAPDNEEAWLSAAASMSVWRLERAVREAAETRGGVSGGVSGGAGSDAGSDAAGRQGDGPGGAATTGAEGLTSDVTWLRRAFAATRPVDEAWQVCLETSRRMAGFDMPVHECVEDLLADYLSGAPASDALEADEAEPAPGRAPGRAADEDPRADGHAAARWAAEAAEDLAGLRRTARAVRLAADPFAGLGGPGGDSEPDPADLHRRIRWLLRLSQNVEWHECRLFRLMADLRLHHFLGFASLRQYAVEALGSGDRRPWSAVALARAIEKLPKVEAAFRRGEITGLEAAEICRVAAGATQDDWVARARTVTLRELRDDVAFVLLQDEMGALRAPGAADGDGGAGAEGAADGEGMAGAERGADGVAGLPPSRPLGRGRKPVAEPPGSVCWPGGPIAGSMARSIAVPISGPAEVQTCAPRTSAAIAQPAARRADGWYAAFGDDPGGVARGMLAYEGRTRPVTFFAPRGTATRWDLTLAHCRAAAGLATDSQGVALILLGFLGTWAHPETLKPSRAHRVFTRDGWRCLAPRCRSRAGLHAHHVVFRSRGGPDAAWNLVTVCATHHRMIHAGVVRVRGRAPCGLEWAMGVNEAGAARERFRNGVRIAFDLLWVAGRRPGGVIMRPS